MKRIRYRGERPNIITLAEEIASTVELENHGEISIIELAEHKQSSESLQHGQWLELLISVGSGVATNALYDGIKVAINKARDRGPINEVGQGAEDNSGSNDSLES